MILHHFSEKFWCKSFEETDTGYGSSITDVDNICTIM